MTTSLVSNWWALVLRGLAGVLLGFYLLTRPGITLLILVLLFCTYAFVDGALAITGAVRASKSNERWGSLVVEGIVSLAAGFAGLLWPSMTLFVFLMMIAIWAVLRGILEIVTAVRLRKLVKGEWLLALGGVLSILFGAWVMTRPGAGALVLAVWTGLYTLVLGAVIVALGFRLKYWHRRPTIS